MSETVEAKAARLLVEGKVRVVGVGWLVVDGDTSRHVVEWDGQRWTCTCTGFEVRARCAHVEAVDRVAVPPGFQPTWTPRGVQVAERPPREF